VHAAESTLPAMESPGVRVSLLAVIPCALTSPAGTGQRRGYLFVSTSVNPSWDEKDGRR